MTGQPNERTAEAIAMVARGASIDDCVALYPDLADELRPLLEAAVAYRHAQADDLTLTARGRLRNRVMAEWDRGPEPVQSRWPWLRLLAPPRIGAPRWAAVALSITLLTLFSGTGTVLASSNAVPGESLYRVKELRESATLWLTLSPETKVAVYTELVRERTEEIRRLTFDGEAHRTTTAATRLEQHVQAIDAIVRDELASADAVAEVVAAEREASVAIQRAIEKSPAVARPGLEEVLAHLQQARSRVDNALESLKGQMNDAHHFDETN